MVSMMDKAKLRKLDSIIFDILMVFFFIQVIVGVWLLDLLLKPVTKSIQDEGIYIGFTLVSVLISVFITGLLQSLRQFIFYKILKIG